ncbi:hypothetical protein NDU88_005884 [Pleurodeles waltl]|uniref:Uncharacterized protein n=1 Tax=Pleurodeles waltl TaxID=8319 RepID=A0AAV7WZK0_PLEWA|nr:hypothetical protein NDU88_005884 [Pleurodeles waltl]
MTGCAHCIGDQGMEVADSAEEKLAEKPLETGYSELDPETIGKQQIANGMPAGPSPGDAMREMGGGEEALTQHSTAILVAIQESKAALENQIATLAGEVGLLRDDHNKLKDQVKATENMLGETTPQVKEFMQKLALMNNELKKLTIKVEDAKSKLLAWLGKKEQSDSLIGEIQTAQGELIMDPKEVMGELAAQMEDFYKSP